MIKITFYAPTKYARYVQDLVKKYDGRFVCNPLNMFNDKSLFDVTFKVGENYNKFVRRADILNQPWV